MGLLLRAVGAGEAVPSRPPAFFGVNADPVWDFKGWNRVTNELPQFVDMLRQSQAGAVRLPIRWRVVEPKKGEWDFSAVDRTIESIPRGVEILALLMSVPAWANGKAPDKVEGWFDAYPPLEVADWERAVGKVVARYKQRIRHWEIWNEQNGVDFYRPQPNARAYTELLKAAWRAAREEDPHCKIVLGGLQMNGIIANPWSPVKVENYLEDLYKAGAGPFFDICNTHPYVLPEEGAEQMMRMTRDTLAVMARYGEAKKPLWLTEVGCGATSPQAREAQARLLRDTYEKAAREPRIERVFWFTLRDLERDIVGPEASMGLFEFKGGAKPAFAAFVGAASTAARK